MSDETAKELFDACHAQATRKGWWEGASDPLTANEVAAKLALIHSEVSEALEAERDGERDLWLKECGKPEGVGIEIADVVIRCADLCGQLGIPLATMIARKLLYNETREHRHGGRRL